MTPARWIAVGLATTALLAIALASLSYGRSLVVIRNVGEHEATVSVSAQTGRQFSWSGRLMPGERVIRPARFSDNSFKVACRDILGDHNREGGYVTNGLPQLVTITIDGCADVSIDVQ